MDGGAGFRDLTPAIGRFFYLKLVTSYATTSSMVLIVYDFCECTRDAASILIPAMQCTHAIVVTTLGQEVRALISERIAAAHTQGTHSRTAI